MKALEALAARWRSDAETLRRYGSEQAATLNELHACELMEALRSESDAMLSQDRAATESGYSTRHLRDLEAAGRLENHGRRGAPLYRRGDLPRKPGHATPDADTRAAALLSKMKRAS